MKKLLALALMGSFTLTVFGQGQVVFNNLNSGIGLKSPVYYQPTADPASAVLADGTLYPDLKAALLGGVTSGTAATIKNAGNLSLLAAPSDATATWVGFRSGAPAGYVIATGDTSRVVSGVDWGGSALVQMVGWKGSETTYAAALAAGDPVGVSNPLTLTLPTGPTSTDLTYLTGLQSFTITGVPEPSTFALAGLGAAALLIFRRRK